MLFKERSIVLIFIVYLCKLSGGMEYCWIHTDEKLKYSKKNPFQHHFVYHKSEGNEIIRVHWE